MQGMIRFKDENNDMDITLCQGLHRSVNNSVNDGYFFVGKERLDKTWLRSGFATQEAILHTTDDSLTAELQRMAGQYDVNAEFKQKPKKDFSI